jgi:hypothetical protein
MFVAAMRQLAEVYSFDFKQKHTLNKNNKRCVVQLATSQLSLPLRWGAGPMALMLWLNLVI